MTEEAETEKKEKLSFVKKCVLLILIPVTVAILVGIVEMFIPNFLGLNPVRELTLYKSDSVGLLNNSALPKDIISSYFLKGKNDKQKKKISSLFLKTIIVRNTGNKGAEKTPLSICLKGKNIFLIDNPKIKTYPEEIIDAIKIQKQAGNTNNKHTWNISLLNPGESVIFEYMIYSGEKVNNLKVNVLARKKEWKVKKGAILDKTKEKKEDIPLILIIAIVLAFAIVGFYNFYLSSKNYQLRDKVIDLLNEKNMNDKIMNNKIFNDKLIK